MARKILSFFTIRASVSSWRLQTRIFYDTLMPMSKIHVHVPGNPLPHMMSMCGCMMCCMENMGNPLGRVARMES